MISLSLARLQELAFAAHVRRGFRTPYLDPDSQEIVKERLEVRAVG